MEKTYVLAFERDTKNKKVFTNPVQTEGLENFYVRKADLGNKEFKKATVTIKFE